MTLTREQKEARARLDALVARDRVLVIDTPAKEADLMLAYGVVVSKDLSNRSENNPVCPRGESCKT